MDRGFTLWFTGLSGAGKTTIGTILENELRQRGVRVEMLDGDVVRTHLSKGLGFSREDRDTNILRIGFVCGLLSRNGVVAIATAISPYRAVRDQLRADIENFIEVYIATSLEECINRDVKGLYAKALKGEIPTFTGVSDPYEAPNNPEITVVTEGRTPEQSAADILGWLEAHQYIPAGAAPTVSVTTAAETPAQSPAQTPVAPVAPVATATVETAAQNGASQNGAYSEEEEAEVSARLADLGYL